jgi:hypothetical protein
MICSLCCAELRMIELACPEGCTYLQEARHSLAERRVPRIVQHLRANGKARVIDALKRFETVIFLLQRAIAGVQRDQFRDIADSEVLEGVTSALKACETFDQNVAHEHTSESLRVQAITTAILKAIDDLKKNLEEKGRSSMITARDFASCLEFIADTMRLDAQSEKNPQAWLRHTVLYQPYVEKEAPPPTVTE